VDFSKFGTAREEDSQGFTNHARDSHCLAIVLGSLRENDFLHSLIFSLGELSNVFCLDFTQKFSKAGFKMNKSGKRGKLTCRPSVMGKQY